jgi:hypothetical protein
MSFNIYNYIHERKFIEKDICYIDFETYLSAGLLTDIKAWQRPGRPENVGLVPEADSVSSWTKCRFHFLETSSHISKGETGISFSKTKRTGVHLALVELYLRSDKHHY